MEKQTCCCKEKREATSKLVFEQGDIYYCGDSKCKEEIEKEIQEDHERLTYQGRTFEQYKTSANIHYYAVLGFIGFAIGYFLYILFSSL